MGLTVTNATLDGASVAIRCEGGTIAALGTDVTPEPDDEVIDAGGQFLVPPFVNGHTLYVDGGLTASV